MTKARKKKIEYLIGAARRYTISEDICVGIYRIETTYRNFVFRMCENICVVIGLILNMLFKIPMKNYTIGCCQLGVSSILNFSGIHTYEHLSHISEVSVEGAKKILAAMYYKNNIDIFCKKIASYYRKEYIRNASEEAKAFYIGQLYNGKFVYGLKLQDFVKRTIKAHYRGTNAIQNEEMNKLKEGIT